MPADSALIFKETKNEALPDCMRALGPYTSLSNLDQFGFEIDLILGFYYVHIHFH